MLQNCRGNPILDAALAPSFVCAYHPEASGSNPKYTINAFSIYIVGFEIVIGMRKRRKIHEKEAGICPNFRTYACNLLLVLSSII